MVFHSSWYLDWCIWYLSRSQSSNFVVAVIPWARSPPPFSLAHNFHFPHSFNHLLYFLHFPPIIFIIIVWTFLTPHLLHVHDQRVFIGLPLSFKLPLPWELLASKLQRDIKAITWEVVVVLHSWLTKIEKLNVFGKTGQHRTHIMQIINLFHRHDSAILHSPSCRMGENPRSPAWLRLRACVLSPWQITDHLY